MAARRQSGQAVAELAILLPVLVLILLGCLDLGRAFSVWLTLANASREGARYACIKPDDLGTIVQAVQDEVEAEGLSLDHLHTPDISTPSGTAGGNPVRVTVTYDLPLATSYLIGGGSVRIRASTEMVLLDSGGGS